MTRKSIIQSLLLAIGFFLMTGCTKEITKECYAGLKLSFNFTLHNNGGNKFGDEVQQLRVYLFDEQGILQMVAKDAGSHLTNDYVMNIDIAPGKYTVVAWAGGNKDFDESYFDADMKDPATSSYDKGAVIGTTKIDNFRMVINHTNLSTLPQDAAPVVDDLDDLYYGAIGERIPATDKYIFEQVEVESGDITERSIELIKNTNIIKVMVTGLEYLKSQTVSTRKSESQVLSISAIAANGRYKFDNSIGEYARTVHYTPYNESEDASSIVGYIKLMRLDMLRHTAQPILLKLENPLTGAPLLANPIDVIATLLQAKNTETQEFLYKSQEDFDREYEHVIEIRISANLHISIFVNDWEVITLTPSFP